MAKIKAIFLRGRIGGIVLAERYGKLYAREARKRIRQTAATRACSSGFGISSRVGSLLREQLGSGIPYPANKDMQNQFTAAIIKWLKRNDPAQLPAQDNLPFISGFSFNPAANECKWIGSLTVQHTGSSLLVQVPAFIPTESFKAPKGTRSIRCSITAAWCGLTHTAAATNQAKQWTNFEFNSIPVAPQRWELQLPAGAAGLIITVASILYVDDDRLEVNQPQWLPSRVIDARYVPDL